MEWRAQGRVGREGRGGNHREGGGQRNSLKHQENLTKKTRPFRSRPLYCKVVKPIDPCR